MFKIAVFWEKQFPVKPIIKTGYELLNTERIRKELRTSKYQLLINPYLNDELVINSKRIKPKINKFNHGIVQEF